MKKNLLLNRVRGYFAFNSKVLRVMRLTSYLVLLTIFQAVAGNSYSQNTRLSFKMNDAKVKEVLNVIEEKSEFYFLFNSKLVDVDRKVDINVSNQQVDKILNNLFAGYNVGYTVMDRQIIIQPGSITDESTAQQTKSLSGKITDSSGASLPGVSVVVKGTTNGTITDSNGNYSISSVPENATMQFSFLGMKMQEVLVGNNSTINIVMEVETIDIEEVVAIGYGTIRKSDLTGAVANIEGSAIKSQGKSDITSSLQGKLAGVTIESAGGNPGSGTRILIRGIGIWAIHLHCTL